VVIAFYPLVGIFVRKRVHVDLWQISGIIEKFSIVFFQNIYKHRGTQCQCQQCTADCASWLMCTFHRAGSLLCQLSFRLWVEMFKGRGHELESGKNINDESLDESQQFFTL